MRAAWVAVTRLCRSRRPWPPYCVHRRRTGRLGGVGTAERDASAGGSGVRLAEVLVVAVALRLDLERHVVNLEVRRDAVAELVEQ